MKSDKDWPVRADSNYEYLRQLVLAQPAKLIDRSRNALFENRLRPLAQVAGGANLEDLVGHLRRERPAHLHRAAAEAMTIHETSFFRNVAPFDTLREELIPRLIAQKQTDRQLRIWSAASSSGQEAYSMAILLLEHFPELADWDVKIIGTDISREVIEYARCGRYRRMEVNRGLRARLLMKYFERDGEAWEICARAREMCEFEVGDLREPRACRPLFDLILLRNVLLYFGQPERSTVFREVYGTLNPEGYLVLGNAEQAEDSTDLFRAEFASGCYVYRPSKQV